MSTRIHEYTQASAFQRLDATVTSADEYANVRDMQLVRKNHNILLARRCRGTVAAFACREATDGDGPAVIESVREVTLGVGGDHVLQFPFTVRPETKQLRLNVYADNAAGGAADVLLYPSIMIPGFATPLPSTSTAITVSAAAETLYGVDIDLNPAIHDVGWGIFILTSATELYGGDIKGGGHDNVMGFGADWIETNSNAGAVGNAIYIPSNVDIAPRLILAEAASGANTRYYVDRAYGPNELDLATPDTADYQLVSPLQLHSVSLYEIEVSEFSDDVEPI